MSAEVARAMAEGALARVPAELSLAVTGIAGPAGATPAKPVGLIHLACARKGAGTIDRRYLFAGERGQVRLAAVEAAIEMLLTRISPR